MMGTGSRVHILGTHLTSLSCCHSAMTGTKREGRRQRKGKGQGRRQRKRKRQRRRQRKGKRQGKRQRKGMRQGRRQRKGQRQGRTQREVEQEEKERRREHVRWMGIPLFKTCIHRSQRD